MAYDLLKEIEDSKKHKEEVIKPIAKELLEVMRKHDLDVQTGIEALHSAKCKLENIAESAKI
jgi:hypothetical protein